MNAVDTIQNACLKNSYHGSAARHVPNLHVGPSLANLHSTPAHTCPNGIHLSNLCTTCTSAPNTASCFPPQHAVDTLSLPCTSSRIVLHHGAAATGSALCACAPGRALQAHSTGKIARATQPVLYRGCSHGESVALVPAWAQPTSPCAAIAEAMLHLSRCCTSRRSRLIRWPCNCPFATQVADNVQRLTLNVSTVWAPSFLPWPAAAMRCRPPRCACLGGRFTSASAARCFELLRSCMDDTAMITGCYAIVSPSSHSHAT